MDLSMVGPPKSDLMKRTGTLQHRTTYLISLTLVKVEAAEEHGGEHSRPSAQGKGTEVREQRAAGSKDEGQFAQTLGEDVEPEAGKCIKLSAGERTPCSPTRHRAPFPDGLHPSDGDKSIISPAAENGKIEAREGSRAPQTCEPKDAADPNSTPTKSSIPVRAGQRPVSLLKTHSSGASRRELKEAMASISTSSKSLDRKDSRTRLTSPASPVPGPCRASWTESEARSRSQDPGSEAGSKGGAIAMRHSPRAKRMNTGSASLPAPVDPVAKPLRKGKSRTLDNSDLHYLSEDLLKGKEGHAGPNAAPHTQPGQSQRASARDHKMLKFISGIFTKSAPVSASSAAASPPRHSAVQRESSEEEAACANSQEWTLSRSIPELRLGVLGSLRSGKSALVNRYITGSYLPLESHEGGRYKKEMLVDGQSHLLLIREESGLPDARFSSWVDAIILVFSLENEASFQEVYKNFSELNTHRSTAEIPLIVVGTQDKISSTNPRAIEDKRAQQLCVDVRRSAYYETCATYGLNVDRVFTEAAQKIIVVKKQAALVASCKSLPNSPSHSGASTPVSGSFPGQASNGGQSSDYSSSLPSTPVVSHKEMRAGIGGEGGSQRILPRRRTSLFTSRRGSDSEKRSVDNRSDVGSARSIAIRQGILWKRSGSSLNKEWKKKYVALSNNGILSYHSSSNDYKQNIHGKEINLLRVTVKVPGKRPPRAVTPCAPSPGVNGLSKDKSASEAATVFAPSGPSNLLPVDEGAVSSLSSLGYKGLQRCPSSLSNKSQSVDTGIERATSPPLGKDHAPSSPMIDRKKKGRKKSINQKGDAAIGQAEAKRKMWKLKSFGSLRNIYKTEEENADFIIISSTGQSWHFEAQSLEERDAWVQAIESQIFACLQCCESRNKPRRNSQSDAVAMQAIRNAKGNNLCVDCEAPNPTWASLNLGALICIECSGIHRNLGTHLSRVRSLDLDDWPRELTKVLTAIGNHMANSIWESCTQGRHKPTPDATREERESWIRAKYEQRVFVAPLLAQGETAGDAMSARLLSAVAKKDLQRLLLLLAHSTKEMINGQPAGAPLQPRTALHAACQLGDVVMTQLLVWYGSDVKAKDPQGLTALTMARNVGSKECAEILLQHGCPNEASPTTPTPVLSRKSSITSLGRVNSRRRVS